MLGIMFLKSPYSMILAGVLTKVIKVISWIIESNLVSYTPNSKSTCRFHLRSI